MPISATLSNHGKYVLDTGAVNLSTDSIKVLLMRSGFTFNKDNHSTKSNLKATTGVANLEVSVALSYTRGAGSFISDGFVPGNSITGSGFTNGGNNVTKIIATVAAGEVTVTSTAGMVSEIGGGGNETIVAEDELVTGFGYTQDTKVLAGQAVSEDDSNDWAQMICSAIEWTAAGGSIGPTPGAILDSDTATGDPIIGYLDFSSEQTATTGTVF